MIELLKNFVNTIRDFGLERAVRRYYSLYRAQVTSTEDPEHRGRILIKVPALFGEDPLPNFAEPRDFRGAGPSKGEFVVPDVDDWVYVEFEMGDHRFPVYSGGWHAEGELDEDEFPHVADVPNTKGVKNKYGHVFKFSEAKGEEKVYLSTPAGHFFILDDTSGAEQVHVIHSTGARLVMDENGSFKFSSANGAFVALDAEQDAVMVNSSQGATVSLKDDITALSSDGGSMLHLDKGIAQLTTSGDLISSANTWTMSAGAIALNALGAGLNLGNAKVALGAGPVELVDQTIKALQALVSSPSLCTTGTGPSGPLSPPAAVDILQVIVLLTTIKGALS